MVARATVAIDSNRYEGALPVMNPKIKNAKLNLRKVTLHALTTQVKGGMMGTWSRCESKCYCQTASEDSDCC